MTTTIINIEGLDSVGKRTQAHMLSDALRKQGLTTRVVSFPMYGTSNYADILKDYLSGELGDLAPYAISALFAGDRQVALKHGLLDKDVDVLILDRYVTSNIVYQGARLATEHRETFSSWCEHMEYVVHGLPRPDLFLYLKLDIHVMKELLRQRDTPDIYEKDTPYIEECFNIYEQLSRGDHWKTVDCNDYLTNGILPPAQICDSILEGASDLIWQYVIT